jgi:hypothetical protein
VLAVGSWAYIFLVRKVEPVEWSADASRCTQLL